MEHTLSGSSIGHVHDEYIADSFYTTGWKAVSTSSLCVNRGCECHASGACVNGFFNHYMIPDDGSVIDEREKCKYLPMLLKQGNVDEISVEEVRCVHDTLENAYTYYDNHVITNGSEQTLISVAINRCKSVCVPMMCYLLEMKTKDVLPGSFCLPSISSGYAYVLAHTGTVLSPLLESICMIGIDPVVSSKGIYNVTVADSVHRELKIEMFTPGFTYSKEHGVNIMGDMRSGAQQKVVRCDEGNINAVRTAIVTLSVVLTPKSFYGGKNPSTKTVAYYVHNVELE